LAILTGALGNGVIGTPYDQTIQATGGVAPYAWTVSNGALPHNLSLTPSTTNTVTIVGTPDTVSPAITFSIQISDSAHHTATQPYTVAILLQADSLVLSPASVNFGNQIVGAAAGAMTETLTNSATTDMLINSIVISPTAANTGEFKQTSTTCGASLAPQASCEVNIAFTPGQPGPRTAVLSITDDTAGSPQSVGLTGIGLTAGPNATLGSTGLVFGTQLFETTSPAQALGLTNYGAVPLNIGSITASSGFAESDDCVPSLASLATCTISVTFTPTGSGAVNGTLSISDDAPNSPQTVSLSGTGATMTPLLTGYCFLPCSLPVKVSACPAGKPAMTPGFSSCPYGPNGPGPGVPVDLDRRCALNFHARGFCETEPQN
jgi:hypothetical protein